jgi:hypothetical protein
MRDVTANPLIDPATDILSEYVCAKRRPLPPATAEWLLRCFGSQRDEDQVGQRFYSNLRDYPDGRANALYWAGALRRIAPTVFRALQKCGLLGLMLAYLKHLLL